MRRTCPFAPAAEYEGLREREPVARVTLPGGTVAWLLHPRRGGHPPAPSPGRPGLRPSGMVASMTYNRGMDEEPTAPDRPGLRERKKERTRLAIVEAARTLFEERGFDGVTVAEIADAAEVSVKTLFAYFESKEELVFADEDEMRDRLLARVSGRAPGQSAFDAVAAFLTDLVLAAGRRPVLAALDGFRRSVDSPAVQSRLRLMWERYEDALARLLASEMGVPAHDPRPRAAAAQLIAVFRLLGSEDVRAYVRSHPWKQQRAALENWLRVTLESVGGGIRHYATRPPAGRPSD